MSDILIRWFEYISNDANRTYQKHECLRCLLLCHEALTDKNCYFKPFSRDTAVTWIAMMCMITEFEQYIIENDDEI